MELRKRKAWLATQTFKLAAWVFVAIGFSSGAFLNISLASDQAGTITQVEGTATLYHSPSQSKPARYDKEQGAPAFLDGIYYLARPARAGLRVQKDNVLQTAPGSRARVVFDNGDQYNVGPDTAYRVTWDADSPEGHAKVDLLYGKVRGVVAKGGPRSKLFIRTWNVTMGVRGTDFYISEAPTTTGTEVVILRGVVEVRSEKEPERAVQVKAGYTAQVQPRTAASATDTKGVASEGVILHQLTQAEATVVRTDSTLPPHKLDELKADVGIATLVTQLESRAIDTTLRDIAHHDPEFYAELKNKQVGSIQELNAMSVERQAQASAVSAPSAPEERKKAPKKKKRKAADENPLDFKLAD